MPTDNIFVCGRIWATRWRQAGVQCRVRRCRHAAGVKIVGAVLFGFFGIALLLEGLTYGGLEGIILGVIFLVVAYNLGRSK